MANQFRVGVSDYRSNSRRAVYLFWVPVAAIGSVVGHPHQYSVVEWVNLGYVIPETFEVLDVLEEAGLFLWFAGPGLGV